MIVFYVSHVRCRIVNKVYEFTLQLRLQSKFAPRCGCISQSVSSVKDIRLSAFFLPAVH